MDLKSATKKPPGDSFKDGSYDPSRIDALLKGRRLTKPLMLPSKGPRSPGAPRFCRAPTSGRRRKRQVRHLRGQVEPVPMGGSAVRLCGRSLHGGCDLLLTGRHITAAEAKEMA